MNIDMLNRSRQLKKEYDDLLMRHDTLKAAVENTVTVISLAPGHGQGVSRRLEDLETEILDLEKTIDKKCEELMDAQNAVNNYINNNMHPPYSVILIRRYAYFQTWEQIASELNYSVPHCYRLHETALKMIVDVTPCYVDDKTNK